MTSSLISVQFINVSDEIAPARRTYNPSTSAAGDTSNSIALSSDRGTLELSGVNLMYEGTRVKSWLVGRDMNPGGRGYGSHYALGDFTIGNIRPIPTTTPITGWGNSVNNQFGTIGGNGFGSIPPPDDGYSGSGDGGPMRGGGEGGADDGGGIDPDKYEECHPIWCPVCVPCDVNLCTPEEWANRDMHEDCCERLRQQAKCDPCTKKCMDEALECYECDEDADPALCCCYRFKREKLWSKPCGSAYCWGTCYTLTLFRIPGYVKCVDGCPEGYQMIPKLYDILNPGWDFTVKPRTQQCIHACRDGNYMANCRATATPSYFVC